MNKDGKLNGEIINKLRPSIKTSSTTYVPTNHPHTFTTMNWMASNSNRFQRPSDRQRGASSTTHAAISQRRSKLASRRANKIKIPIRSKKTKTSSDLGMLRQSFVPPPPVPRARQQQQQHHHDHQQQHHHQQQHTFAPPPQQKQQQKQTWQRQQQQQEQYNQQNQHQQQHNQQNHPQTVKL